MGLTLGSYLEESRRVPAGFLFAVPLFACYEAGLLLMPPGGPRNAADAILKGALGLEGRLGSLLLNAGVLATFLVLALRGGAARRFRLMPLVLLESGTWAVLLVPLIALLPLAGGIAPESRAGQAILALGAGLYEETLFRLIPIAGGYFLLYRLLRVEMLWAVVLPLILSSIAFSAYHHLGPDGEPWDPRVFMFRFLAGVILAVLFLLRGFGVACWTHALYDVWVLLA